MWLTPYDLGRLYLERALFGDHLSEPTHSLLAYPPPEKCKGLHRVEDSSDGYPRYACIKCGYLSGDDWSQCYGRCPSEQSPHYSVECLEEYLPVARRIQLLREDDVDMGHTAELTPIECYEE